MEKILWEHLVPRDYNKRPLRVIFCRSFVAAVHTVCISGRIRWREDQAASSFL